MKDLGIAIYEQRTVQGGTIKSGYLMDCARSLAQFRQIRESIQMLFSGEGKPGNPGSVTDDTIGNIFLIEGFLVNYAQTPSMSIFEGYFKTIRHVEIVQDIIRLETSIRIGL